MTQILGFRVQARTEAYLEHTETLTCTHLGKVEASRNPKASTLVYFLALLR